MKKLLALLSVFTLLCSNVFCAEITVKDSIINAANKTEEYDFNKMNAFNVKNETKTALVAGSPLNIVFQSPVSSETVNTGDTIGFILQNDIKNQNGEFLIKKGTPVYGEIIAVKKKAKAGRSGIVTIGNFYANACDGTIITSSSNVTEKAKSNVSKSIILSVAIFPLFLLMDGKDAVIPAGTEKTIYTNNTVYIKGETL